MPREVRQRQNDSDEEDEVVHAIEDSPPPEDDSRGMKQGSDEEEEDDDDEVYEIERIIHHKNNHFGRGVRGYFVKWKGYPDAENSWVNENDCNAEEIIKEYWEEFHAKRKANTGKRARSSQPPTDVEMEEDVDRPNKKSKQQKLPKETKSRSKSKKTDSNGRTKFQTLNDASSDALESSPTPSEIISTNFKTMDRYMHLDDWHNLIDQILTVDYRDKPDEGRRVIYFFKLKNGETRTAPGDAVRKRASSIVIDFYEQNLRFEHVQGTAGP
ncbi:hypothetical protein PIIN_05807 [Serendipita indica DSM 11827]|uniref:Chromo domain-containing protein n=1 Tax=Serendipita indica (strain DSM 11827) TaxID=1109443 RepID=G4TKM8_SERID|nr:hypothetical protein PIIN_05807 [Serendipita indica DSM 11827]